MPDEHSEPREESAATPQCRRRRALAAVPLLLLALAPGACGPSGPELATGPYLPRSAHQAYGHALAQAGLTRTALGRAWIGSAEQALRAPREVSLPFAVDGGFDPAAAEALGYAFKVRPGQRLSIVVSIEPGATHENLEAFVDLYRVDRGRPVQVASAAPATQHEGDRFERWLEIEVFEAQDYVLRVQPELLRGGTYRVEIRTQPLLAFPVEGHGPRAILSGYGAPRDGGRRIHRGVDIFAPRGTPVLAAFDAWVTRVQTTPVGGNVVWLQSLFDNTTLYYAHLDEQWVERGQFVAAGEPLGTIGNTGNAVTTPPHLHFGLYLRRAAFRGATDPDPFLR
jgi:peptidoglycan LD-endopeptidase LytH